MDKFFTPNELRIIGSLIEKELTTPDNYPLSVNALTNACNQKSNREPTMNLSEIVVQQTADNLVSRSILKADARSRVKKYSHRLRREDRLFDELAFDDDEVAVLAALFLRGAQTLNEIKTRTSRLYPFETLDAVADTIAKLEAHTDGPFATMTGRQSGQKEDRYGHLFLRGSALSNLANNPGSNNDVRPTATSSPATVESSSVSTVAPTASNEGTSARIASLEERVKQLESIVDELKIVLE